MNKRRLILAGGTVAFAAIGAARRNRRAPRGHRATHPHRAVLAATLLWPRLTATAFGWDGAGVISSAWGFLSSLGSDIKDWVLETINFFIEKALNAVELVTDGLQWGLDQFAAGIGIVAGQIADVTSAVAHVTNQTLNWVEETFSNFRQQLKDFLEHAWDDLKDWVIDNFPDWIAGLFGDLWGILEALAGIGVDGIGFLIDLIDDPIGFLWNLLSDVVTDAIDAALGGLHDALAVLAKIWHIIEWLATHADDLTEEVLSTLWGGLKWIIDHLDDFTIDVIEDLLSSGGESLVVRAGDEGASESGEVSDRLATIFGLN